MEAPRILAVRFSAIGDILLTTPLLRALRRRHPGARLEMLTWAHFTPLLADNPHLDQVHGPPRGTGIPELAELVRAGGYTHLLDLHGSLRTRRLRLAVRGPWRGYRKHRVARTWLILRKQDRYPRHLPTAERYFDAAADLDVAPDGGPPEFAIHPTARATAAAWLRDRGLGQRRPLVAFAPGAAHATKRWPLEHWEALLRKVAGKVDVVIVGGPEDAEAGAWLAEAAPEHVGSAAGPFGLQESGALIAAARALVAGDTGAMHMATGVGTPAIALFGPTVEAFGFFPYRARATVLQRPVPCRPCSAKGGDRCPLAHHRCLREITPDHVISALQRWLA